MLIFTHAHLATFAHAHLATFLAGLAPLRADPFCT